MLVSLLCNQLELRGKADHVFVLRLLEGEVVLVSNEAVVAGIEGKLADTRTRRNDGRLLQRNTVGGGILMVHFSHEAVALLVEPMVVGVKNRLARYSSSCFGVTILGELGKLRAGSRVLDLPIAGLKGVLDRGIEGALEKVRVDLLQI